MKVVYINTVTIPSHLAGKVGEERDLPDRDAERLIDEGYVRKAGNAVNTGTSATS